MTAGRSPAPALSPEELEVVERFEGAPVIEEAFDATAALRRVLDLADDLEGRYLPMSPAAGQAWDIAAEIRYAVNGYPR